MQKILVSSCLLGDNCRYDGKNNLIEDIAVLKDKYKIVKFCPEEAGGLKTPRSPSEIQGEKIVNAEGEDVTEYFKRGAELALKKCMEENIKIAILKERSPSCGSDFVYDGTFSGQMVGSMGVTAQLLKNNGIWVLNEYNYKEVL
ncbi:Protein of unknown function [Peptoniphilus sp. ING2-D1G]|nr:Protein of unknown function [Peptoniphilus sp. ING2-D1G]